MTKTLLKQCGKREKKKITNIYHKYSKIKKLPQCKIILLGFMSNKSGNKNLVFRRETLVRKLRSIQDDKVRATVSTEILNVPKRRA